MTVDNGYAAGCGTYTSPNSTTLYTLRNSSVPMEAVEGLAQILAQNSHKQAVVRLEYLHDVAADLRNQISTDPAMLTMSVMDYMDLLFDLLDEIQEDPEISARKLKNNDGSNEPRTIDGRVAKERVNKGKYISRSWYAKFKAKARAHTKELETKLSVLESAFTQLNAACDRLKERVKNANLQAILELRAKHLVIDSGTSRKDAFERLHKVFPVKALSASKPGLGRAFKMLEVPENVGKEAK